MIINTTYIKRLIKANKLMKNNPKVIKEVEYAVKIVEKITKGRKK